MFLAAIICCLSLYGCNMTDKSYPDATVGDAADEPYASIDGANIECTGCDRTSLSVRITNASPAVWQSGNMREYELHRKEGDVWYRVEQIGEFANTMELMIFPIGDTVEHTFDFSVRYGALPDGSYRLVKSCWAHKTENSDAAAFALVLEFEIN